MSFSASTEKSSTCVMLYSVLDDEHPRASCAPICCHSCTASQRLSERPTSSGPKTLAATTCRPDTDAHSMTARRCRRARAHDARLPSSTRSTATEPPASSAVGCPPGWISGGTSGSNSLLVCLRCNGASHGDFPAISSLASATVAGRQPTITSPVAAPMRCASRSPGTTAAGPAAWACRGQASVWPARPPGGCTGRGASASPGPWTPLPAAPRAHWNRCSIERAHINVDGRNVDSPCTLVAFLAQKRRHSCSAAATDERWRSASGDSVGCHSAEKLPRNSTRPPSSTHARTKLLMPT
mmetsp:Transcript_15325/g.38938  ORF Transcript_15325/g.38938 Transcript_15325/m.38938 type:complete len:297 (-) Transcript_15325:1174-2064(-)